MNKIIKAIQLANLAHKGQYRKYGDVPYITHPARVSAYVGMYCWNIAEVDKDLYNDMQCVAWLHDTLEDSKIVTYTSLVEDFGTRVACGISSLTNVYTKEAYPSLSRFERKKHELDRLSTLPSVWRIIKMLDRYDNVLDLPKKSDFTVIYFEESKKLLKQFELLFNMYKTDVEGAIIKSYQEVYNLLKEELYRESN